MNKNLIKHVMNDEEVKLSNATSYQIAIIISSVLEYQNNQPKRNKREDLTTISEPSDQCKAAMAKIFWR